MKRNLLIATAAAALIASGGLSYAQSPNAAPGTAQKTNSDVKTAPRTGETGNVGATPSADSKAMQRQKGSMTQNGAPTGSTPQQADTKKQAEGVGDSEKVGGTSSGNAATMNRHTGSKRINNAPVGSNAQKEDQTKHGARTGDAETQGGMKKKGM
jgi:hypothetical protein